MEGQRGGVAPVPMKRRITAEAERPAPLRTLAALLHVRSFRRTAILLGIAYFLPLQLALGLLSRGGREATILLAPWTRMFERTSAFSFEAVAQLTVPGVTILFSPLNILVTGALAGLAGLNLAMTLTLLRDPRACDLRSVPTVLGALPPLLAGGACCAPTLLLVLGIQASTLIIALSQILIPGSLVLLFGTLLWTLRRMDVRHLPTSVP
ncbi:MAG: hypothetical protein WEG36_15470 [Gemmatimonadota bacterium]